MRRVTDTDLRQRYLAWTRHAVLALLLPLALTALLQAGAATEWWSETPLSQGGMRYLFMAIGAAAVMMGRSARARETAVGPLPAEAIVSLSWRLVIYILAPAVTGAVLAFMTRQLGDYYIMLVVTLVGLVMLYPRFDQWLAWAAPVAEEDAADGSAATDATPAARSETLGLPGGE